jgi:hypothetical protein
MINFLKQLFSKKKEKGLPKDQNGFYENYPPDNKTNHKGWVEYIKDSKGGLVPLFPPDRTEIH